MSGSSGISSIGIIPVGAGAELELLDELAAALAFRFRVSCRVEAAPLDAGFAHDVLRGQYYSTALLAKLEQEYAGPREVRILGVTPHDLFVPVLTFVFGEAQLGGRCALVSLRRLSEEFYGLPPNPALLFERLVKEAVHELGHTFGLRHCHNWQCVMASTHSVERMDLKTADFCAACARAAGLL